jgi:hypothetical protein
VEILLEALLVELNLTYGVENTLITDTGTDSRGEPLTEIDLSGKTTLTLEIGPSEIIHEFLTVEPVPDTSVPTSTYANESIVEGLVGLISTANDVAVLVTIVVLLSESVHREEEACCSKNSNDSFDTFHD